MGLSSPGPSAEATQPRQRTHVSPAAAGPYAGGTHPGFLGLFGAGVLRIAIFLVAILVVRGVPALLYRHLEGWPDVAAAALFQATTLSIPVVGSAIGVDLALSACSPQRPCRPRP